MLGGVVVFVVCTGFFGGYKFFNGGAGSCVL